MSNHSKEQLLEMILKRPQDFNNYKKNVGGEIDLSELDFSGANLSHIDFSNADLTSSCFSECNIELSDFSNCELSSAEFTRSTVVETDFSGSILNGTDFSYSTVNFCNFVEADMAGCIFIETDLLNSDLAGSENLVMCRFDESTIWPDIDMLPEDFDTSYCKDLSELDDENEHETTEI